MHAQLDKNRQEIITQFVFNVGIKAFKALGKDFMKDLHFGLKNEPISQEAIQ